MKLSSFPYVAQKEILDHLSINNIFFLSLCSKRTKNAITEIQKYQFQKVEQVIYRMNSEIMSISVKQVSRKGSDLFMDCYRSPSEFAEVLPEIEETSEELRVNVFGTTIDFFRSRTNRSDLQLKYCSDSLESILETIHNFLCDVLGHHPKSWFSSNSETTHCLPMIKNTHVLSLAGGRIDSKRIDELLSKTSCLKYIGAASRYGSTRFKKNSKFFNSDDIYAATPSPLNTDILKHFNGRNAFLKGCNISSYNVVHFLNSWKLGKKFRNLEVMSMEQDDHFDISSICNSVEFKEVNTEVDHSFITRYQERDLSFSSIQPWEFDRNLYMIRESDGHVASVILTNERIFMVVWDLTEKQFLERLR